MSLHASASPRRWVNDMKLSESKEMQIMPIKKLCSLFEKKPSCSGAIVIICSRNEFDKSCLKAFDAYLVLEIDDTLMEESRYAFKERDGETVKSFLEENKDFEKLFVCCDSGESRSTALAAAILKHFGKSDREIWENPYFHPNMLVYRNQLRAFGRETVKLKILYLNKRRGK